MAERFGYRHSVGLLCAALFPGLAQRKRRPGMTAPGHTHGIPWVIAAPSTRPTPNGRRGPRQRLCCPPCRPVVPCALAGGACAPSGVQGRRGNPRPWQRRGWDRTRARAGATHPSGAGVVSPAPGVRGWGGWRHVLCHGWSASPGVRGGCRRWQAVAVGDAIRAVFQKRQASTGGPREVGRRAGHEGTERAIPWACRHVRRRLPRPTGQCMRGWGRSVAVRHGTPRQSPATQHL